MDSGGVGDLSSDEFDMVRARVLSADSPSWSEKLTRLPRFLRDLLDL